MVKNLKIFSFLI